MAIIHTDTYPQFIIYHLSFIIYQKMSPLFHNLIESSDASRALKRDAEAGRVSHTYLLNAPDNLAGTITARLFAAYCLLDVVNGGSKPPPYDGITRNNWIAQTNVGRGLAPAVLHGSTLGFDTDLIFAQKHPDVVELPFAGTDGKPRENILTADIDKLIAGLYIRPSRGSQKFYILNGAETMNPQSQNKLLKTLEEPPPSVRLILNCRAVHALLPTVVSRCKAVEIRPFAISAIRDELTREFGAGERADLAAALSRGSLTEAQSFIADKKRADLFRLSLNALLTLKSSKDVLDAAAGFSNLKGGMEHVLEFFEVILRDVMVIKEGAPALCALQANLADMIALSALYSTAAVVKILPMLAKLKKRLSLNANSNSLIDELLFTTAEYRVKFRDS